jgi:tetratricopeptide (TPR) repeat protein
MRYRDGELDSAASFYRKALALNPDYAEALNNLAVVLFYQKDYRGAIERYDRAKGLGLSNPVLEAALEPYR